MSSSNFGDLKLTGLPSQSKTSMLPQEYVQKLWALGSMSPVDAFQTVIIRAT